MQHFIAALCSLLFIATTTSAQQNPAYQIFNAKGKKVAYRKMVKQLAGADIVLFGELHNNPIAHWLQLEVAQDLHAKNELILGAEMFERDNQDELNSYLNEKIDRETLDSTIRLWSNFETDYRPLVDFAKANNLPFIATNIPRRYANLVYRKGFDALDTLSEQEKEWIAPLPIAYDAELPGYKNMLDMMPGHGGENLPKAQAIKDATMAYSILENYEPDSLFLHLNGAYHSENYEGILWYLQQKEPNLDYKTITTVLQENIGKLTEENKGKADFIICVPENMTTTY